MKSILLLCVVVAGALAAPSKHDGHDHEDHGDHTGHTHCECELKSSFLDKFKENKEEAKAQSLEISYLTADIVNFKRGMDERNVEGNAMEDKARHVLHRVRALEGHECPDGQYFCGGHQHECVSNLLVCDGDFDCSTHRDEEHCQNKVPVGSEWVGSLIRDDCTQRRPKHMSVVITENHVVPYFPARPQLTGRINIDASDNDAHEHVSLVAHGYFNYATHSMVFLPPEDDGLGLHCQFDGIDDNVCDGHVLHEATLESCAHFEFHRKMD